MRGSFMDGLMVGTGLLAAVFLVFLVGSGSGPRSWWIKQRRCDRGRHEYAYSGEIQQVPRWRQCIHCGLIRERGSSADPTVGPRVLQGSDAQVFLPGNLPWFTPWDWGQPVGVCQHRRPLVGSCSDCHNADPMEYPYPMEGLS